MLLFNFTFNLFKLCLHSGIIADRVNLRYYLVIGMLGESKALVYIIFTQHIYFNLEKK